MIKEDFYKTLQIEIEKRFSEFIVNVNEYKLEVTGFCIDEVTAEYNNEYNKTKSVIRCSKVTHRLEKLLYTHLNTENVPIKYKASDANLHLYTSLFFRTPVERRMWTLLIIERMKSTLGKLKQELYSE